MWETCCTCAQRGWINFNFLRPKLVQEFNEAILFFQGKRCRTLHYNLYGRKRMGLIYKMRLIRGINLTTVTWWSLHLFWTLFFFLVFRANKQTRSRKSNDWRYLGSSAFSKMLSLTRSWGRLVSHRRRNWAYK